MPFHMSIKQGSYAFIKHIPWQFQDSSTTKLYYSMTQIFSMADHTSSTHLLSVNFLIIFFQNSMTLLWLFTYKTYFHDFSHTMKNSVTFHIQWKIPGLFTYNEKFQDFSHTMTKWQDFSHIMTKWQDFSHIMTKWQDFSHIMTKWHNFSKPLHLHFIFHDFPRFPWPVWTLAKTRTQLFTDVHLLVTLFFCEQNKTCWPGLATCSPSGPLHDCKEGSKQCPTQFFFFVPQLYLWGSPFLVRFLPMWPFLTLTTWQSHSSFLDATCWVCFLLLAFAPLGHDC